MFASSRRLSWRSTPAISKYVLDRYMAGETAPALGKELGLRAQTIHKWTHNAGMHKPEAMIVRNPPHTSKPVVQVLPHEPINDETEVVELLRKLFRILSS